MITPEIKYELEVKHGSIYGPEEEAAAIECIRNRAPSCGAKVKEFEGAFAEYCGVKHALAVTNCTNGLTLAGVAAGVGPGTEVITTPISWVATSMAFSVLGADIVFCDVDPRTLNLSPDHLEELITPKTRAIVPVHLFGQCAEMDRINAIAKKHGIPVIEDAAHNPGGSYLGKKAGSLADMGVFSFHQQKNMGTLGEGGMVTTDNRELYDQALSYRSLNCLIYGGSDKYLPADEKKYPMNREYWKLYFGDIGYNFRMTDIQAAVGIEQLKKLEGHNAKRIALAQRLTEKLSGVEGLTLPWIDPRGEHVFHLYLAQIEESFPLNKRDLLWALYTEKGIKAWSHYMLIHLTDPYLEKGHKEGECPNAEAAVKKHFTLPLHPRLTFEAIDYMADCIRELAGK